MDLHSNRPNKLGFYRRFIVGSPNRMPPNYVWGEKFGRPVKMVVHLEGLLEINFLHLPNKYGNESSFSSPTRVSSYPSQETEHNALHRNVTTRRGIARSPSPRCPYTDRPARSGGRKPSVRQGRLSTCPTGAHALTTPARIARPALVGRPPPLRLGRHGTCRHRARDLPSSPSHMHRGRQREK